LPGDEKEAEMSDYRWRNERDRYRADEDQDRSRSREGRFGSQDFRRHAGDRNYPDYGQGRDFGRDERNRGGGRDFGGGRSGWSGSRDYDYERSIDRSGPGDYSESLRYGRQTGFDEYPSRGDYPRSERDEWQDYARRSGGWGRHDWTGGAGTYGERWARSEDRRGRGEDRGLFERAADEVSSWFGDEDAERRRERDARGDGRRGRGPRGYKRSDERIREDVCDRLTDDPMVDASDIEVTVSGAEVTLAGTVDSREERRRAEDLVERILGVGHVQNNLRIKDHGMSGSGAGQVSGSRVSQAGGAVGEEAARAQPRKSV
jgi:osmotically-inducible protein OsmY